MYRQIFEQTSRRTCRETYRYVVVQTHRHTYSVCKETQTQASKQIDKHKAGTREDPQSDRVSDTGVDKCTEIKPYTQIHKKRDTQKTDKHIKILTDRHTQTYKQTDRQTHTYIHIDKRTDEKTQKNGHRLAVPIPWIV